MPSDDLAVLSANLLDSVATRLTAEGITVPARRYVHAGGVAHDCEQLVVAWARIANLNAPTTGPLRPMVIRQARIEVHWVVCVPTSKTPPTPPDETELDQAGMDILTAALALARILVEGKGDWIGSCAGWSLAEIVPIGPLGAFGGIVARIDVDL